MRTAKRWISLLLCLAMMAGMMTFAAAEGEISLVEKDGKLYGYDADGNTLYGWQTIGEDQYCFDYYGAALTGRVYVGSRGNGHEAGYYYFGTDGKMRTGWQTIDDSRYYFAADGLGAIGWQTIGGSRYYFGSDGRVTTGAVMIWNADYTSSSQYFFDSEGRMLTGWVTDGEYKYYCREDGTMVSGGFFTIDGATYYLNPAAATGACSFYNAETKEYESYYFDEDGKLQTGWIALEEQDGSGDTVKRKYYYGSDGQKKTGWQTIDGATYYFNTYAITGLNSIWDEDAGESYTYYFDGDGKMQTGLVDLGEDGVYYFSKDGRAQTGWVDVGSDTYHFRDYTHRADTGIVRIDKAYYCFDEKGVMQTGWNDADSKGWGWRMFGDNGAMIESFAGWSSVTVPSKVTKLQGDAFAGIGRDFVIYCDPGSYAESFARKSGLQYDNGQKRVVGYNITNVNDKAKWIVANYTDDSMSSLEKVRVLHDWLVNNAHYDYSYSSYSANGVLVNGAGVCQSYAEAFLLLMQTAGIECVLMSGSADNGSGNGPEGHAWNMVKLGDHWYHLDATWDDPTWGSADKNSLPAVSGLEYYRYFLISDEAISRNHYWYSNLKAPVSIAYEGEPGWQVVSGEWVYYDEDGYLTTGPAEIDGKLYGFGEDGRLMAKGWHTVKGKYCYADDGGILVTDDWVGGGSDWYYLDENGYMKTGWIKVDDDWYCLAEDGKMQTGWVKSGNNWYLLRTSGAMAVGWAYDGSDWYYFSEDGLMQTGWIEDDGSWYYLGTSGAMQTGWIQSSGRAYLMTAGGAMATGWAQDGGKWYYFDDNGAMQTGWVQDDGSWYLLGADGAMKTGWITDGGTRYLLQSGGRLATGWVQDGGRWYWFSGDGIMAKGWAEIDGQWEMFDNNGVWQYTWQGN